MKQFQSIGKLDKVILYLLELVSSLSILLLAFGLIASVGDVLIHPPCQQKDIVDFFFLTALSPVRLVR